MSVTTISESSSAMFQTAPMRTLPVIFASRVFLPRYRQRSVSPGLGVRGVKRGCFAIGAVKQGNGCRYASAWRAVLGNVGKRLEGFGACSPSQLPPRYAAADLPPGVAMP